ncbi:hypothetical protein DN757_19300 [Paenibacillus silvae]|uniref:Bacterial transcriptional activator domain-containing protein n=1 Tax=Paenibacillus silvae TaxID=1325358 RepID=A0A2W6NE87_9BACL|nr:hypothetical protein DN757_19300 [Paenibacillus silvae]
MPLRLKRDRVDLIIQMLEEQLDGLDENFGSSNNDHLYQYCYQRALYEQWMGRPQGAVEYILKAMRVVNGRGVERSMLRCILVLESLREVATEEHIEQYRAILEGMK